MSVINTVPPETVREFYTRHYHPERMAVVAVGDFEDGGKGVVSERKEWSRRVREGGARVPAGQRRFLTYLAARSSRWYGVHPFKAEWSTLIEAAASLFLLTFVTHTYFARGLRGRGGGGAAGTTY